MVPALMPRPDPDKLLKTAASAKGQRTLFGGTLTVSQPTKKKARTEEASPFSFKIVDMEDKR